MSYITIDSSTSSTTVIVFNEKLEIVKRFQKEHRQIITDEGYIEHDLEEIYQNLLDSGALSSSEALQYGSFVRNLPPPSNTYGLSPEIKPGIEGIDLQGNFPGVL